MKINCDPFLKALGTLIIFFFVAFFPAKRDHSYANHAKLKSRLKQIGTTVAMYYSDGTSNLYPDNPSLYYFDESIMFTNNYSNWLEINLNTPYIFIPFSGDEYTGSADKPLAMNWEPFEFPPHYQVVYEDGHVSPISEEEAYKLMNSSLKNSVSFIIYKLLAKKNEAL